MTYTPEMTLRTKIMETLRDYPHMTIEERTNIIIRWFIDRIDYDIEMEDGTGYRDPRTCWEFLSDLEKLIGGK